MIREIGLNFDLLKDEDYDEMMGKSTGAGTIFGTTGGVAEAAARTVKEKVTGEELERFDLGFKGVSEVQIEIGEQRLNIAIVNGLAKADAVMEKVRAGESEYDFIEIMACPHGCVGGGGQPLPVDKEIKDKRGKGLANIDEHKTIRKSHENPMIVKLYEDYLGEPLSGESHHLLHTKYKRREKN
jgi:NADH-quinone oxidoreductase subunit G/NADP-reducing hydrogenase subunit HndD